MKKLVCVVLAMFSVSVFADNRHHRGHHNNHYNHHRNYNYNWVAPAIIGGVVVYGLTRPAPVIVQEPRYSETLQWNDDCQCWRKVIVVNY